LRFDCIREFRRSYDAGGDELLAGKTGTCSDQLSHVGWFLTYADEAHPKIALAVLLRGNSRIKGPAAATSIAACANKTIFLKSPPAKTSIQFPPATDFRPSTFAYLSPVSHVFSGRLTQPR
jgi:hypothetical protein